VTYSSRIQRASGKKINSALPITDSANRQKVIG